MVAAHFPLQVAGLGADAAGAEQQPQPHLDGVARHGEALPRQARASCKQSSRKGRSGLFPVHSSAPAAPP